LDRQSLFDIAVQAMGSAEAAFELAMLNDLSVTDDLIVGQPVGTRRAVETRHAVQTRHATSVQNPAIANYYSNRQLKPATGITENTLTGRIFDNTHNPPFN
jgi:hypothetical protein